MTFKCERPELGAVWILVHAAWPQSRQEGIKLCRRNQNYGKCEIAQSQFINDLLFLFRYHAIEVNLTLSDPPNEVTQK